MLKPFAGQGQHILDNGMHIGGSHALPGRPIELQHTLHDGDEALYFFLSHAQVAGFLLLVEGFLEGQVKTIVNGL